uniref:RING-type domain-containing protein n=1 Tax=Neospora caninum (strain Liverpool) TaxID=572307 RepID=A0A0F7UA08_NEOCL|nr:TPA: hypothetical protein BN1204_025115 [Neospora caninum Liverpool]
MARISSCPRGSGRRGRPSRQPPPSAKISNGTESSSRAASKNAQSRTASSSCAAASSSSSSSFASVPADAREPRGRTRRRGATPRARRPARSHAVAEPTRRGEGEREEKEGTAAEDGAAACRVSAEGEASRFQARLEEQAVDEISKGVCGCCLDAMVDEADADGVEAGGEREAKRRKGSEATETPQGDRPRDTGESEETGARQPQGVLLGKIECCSHNFHLHCIEGWSRRETTCPLCKAVFTSIAAYDLSTGALLAEHTCAVVFQADASSSEEESSEEEEEDDEYRGRPRSRRMSRRTAERLRRSLREHHRTHTLMQRRRQGQSRTRAPGAATASSCSSADSSAAQLRSRGATRTRRQRASSAASAAPPPPRQALGCKVLWRSHSSRGRVGAEWNVGGQLQRRRRSSSSGADASTSGQESDAERRRTRETRDAQEASQAIRRTERHLARLKFFNFSSTLQQLQPEGASSPSHAPQGAFIRDSATRRRPQATSADRQNEAEPGSSCSRHSESHGCPAQNTSQEGVPKGARLRCAATVECMPATSASSSRPVILRISPSEKEDASRTGGADSFPSGTEEACTEGGHTVEKPRTEREPVHVAVEQRNSGTCVAVVVPWKARVNRLVRGGTEEKANAKDDVEKSGCNRTESAVGHQDRRHTGPSFGNFALRPRYEEDFLIQRKL